METAIILGKDFEHLSELITLQHSFSNIPVDDLYEEVVNYINNRPKEGLIIVSALHINNMNPRKIEKTDNFQFLIDDTYIAISNKFY